MHKKYQCLFTNIMHLCTMCVCIKFALTYLGCIVSLVFKNFHYLLTHVIALHLPVSCQVSENVTFHFVRLLFMQLPVLAKIDE